VAKVAVILTNGFADWEYGFLAGAGGAFYGLEVRFFAPEGGELVSIGGLTVKVSSSINDLAEWGPKTVVVIGGNIWETEIAPNISNVLNTHYESGGVVAGICGGTLALARAGLLDKTAHTSNELKYLTEHADSYSGADFFCESSSAVSGERIITAPGTAPVSFTAAIFESVGLEQDVVQQFRSMLAAEHS
jgi:putative intracellular protease/amidase